MSSTETWQEAKRRIEAWWEAADVDRPAVACRISRPDAPPAPLDDQPEEQKELDPQWHARMAAWQMEAFDYPAESPRGTFPQYASNLMLPAALAGGTVEYHPETAWLVPDVGIYDREVPDFDADHPVFCALNNAIRAQYQTVAPMGGMVSAPGMLDGLTTLSLFRGQEQLCLDVIERPDDVRRWTDALDEIQIVLHSGFWETLVELGQPHTITWCEIFAPGRAEMVQCDFAVMLSEAMFEEFAMPSLRRLTEYYDYSCYHLDGTSQTRFLDRLASLESLRGIQWNPEPGSPRPEEWLEFFRDVRRRGLSLWVHCPDIESAEALTRDLGPAGLMLSIQTLRERTLSVDEALDRLLAASR